MFFMYDLILDGLNSLSDGKKCFWIDLTTDKGVKSDIWSDFMVLLSEIESVYPDGLSWFAVQTNEGNGVIHFLIKEVYLPSSFYEGHWSRIHKSFMVRRREVVKDLIKSDGVYDGFDTVGVYFSTQNLVERVDFSDLWFSDKSLLVSAYKFKSSFDGLNKRLF